MSTPREIIADAIDGIADDYAEFPSSEVIAGIVTEALTAAGFRILGPDEVDALDRLRARADAWPLNSDSARVSVRLGDLRALGRKA